MTNTLTEVSSSELERIVGGDGLSRGETVYVNGQRGQVIGNGLSGGTVVETRDFRGRSTGTATLSAYDQGMRRVLNARIPSFVVGPRNGHELKRFRARGF